jgi:amylosucrase
MSVVWEAVATREAILVADALSRRSSLGEGCQWLSYLRSHDDIGWGFADEDATAHGIEPAGHRRFLNEFYSGEYPGSFAEGARFQHNPRTGDSRISGTLASLAGLERAVETADVGQIDLAVDRIVAMLTVVFASVGIPMIFLGDELGACNDHRFADDPDHEKDNRWMHRPKFDWSVADRASVEPTSPAGRISRAVRRLVEVRASIPGLGHDVPSVLASGDPAVLALLHHDGGERVLCVVNLADSTRSVDFASSLDSGWEDLFDGTPVAFDRPLRPYETVIVRGVASTFGHGVTD